ncbi:hypothetical protein SALBM311S_12474 [Streptomyces alboniger]
MNGPALHERPSPAASASWRIALPHSAAAVPVARALVRTALAELSHGADRDTAELLTAELVANAVEHTAGDAPIELVVELPPTGCQVGCTTRTRCRPAISRFRWTSSPTPGRSTDGACC